MKDFSLIELLKGFGRKRVNEDPYPEATEHPVLHDLDILVLADTHHAIPADQLYQKTQTDPDLQPVSWEDHTRSILCIARAVFCCSRL